jgi:archaellum biogenesis protein FlaJ (TadC family)
MSNLKVIIILVIITLIAGGGAYLVKQHIEDNKKLAPELNDTPEMNKYYNWILVPFQIPLIVTIIYLLYQILLASGIIEG